MVRKITQNNYCKGTVPLWRDMSQENPKVKLGVFRCLLQTEGSVRLKAWEWGGAWCLWETEDRGPECPKGVANEKQERKQTQIICLFLWYLYLLNRHKQKKLLSMILYLNSCFVLFCFFVLARYCDGPLIDPKGW